MLNRDSTLYQLDNAMAELHYAIMVACDAESWINPNQFMVGVSRSLVDIRREFENRGQEFQYPSLSVFRDPTLNIQSDNNMNVKPHTVEQNNNIIDVRPITLKYVAIIIDYRKKYIDEYYELLVMNLYKYSPRIDVKCKIGIDANGDDFIFHNLASVSYDIDNINISAIPSYDDKTTGNGQIYALTVPFNVDTQLVGNYQESKLIHQMIVNYVEMDNENGFKEVDQFSTVPKDIVIEKGN